MGCPRCEQYPLEQLAGENVGDTTRCTRCNRQFTVPEGYKKCQGCNELLLASDPNLCEVHAANEAFTVVGSAVYDAATDTLEVDE